MSAVAHAFSGIYPMQYAFYSHTGALDRDATRRQVEGSIAGGAHGLAVLGLGTEVSKLSIEERRTLIAWVTSDAAGRIPVAVTIAGRTVEEQAALADFAQRSGAAWLILQPPAERGREESHYVEFFSRVMEPLRLPVAIQNAPEYTGIGLGEQALNTLAARHPHFALLKGEGSALSIRRALEALNGRLGVFNGRGGLELVDNLRAGCIGMIPATDTFDWQVRIFEHMRAGDETSAELLYREMLPATVFVMQSLDTLICYGKRIAARRLGLGLVYDREPCLRPEPFGVACANRYADALGPLS